MKGNALAPMRLTSALVRDDSVQASNCKHLAFTIVNVPQNILPYDDVISQVTCVNYHNCAHWASFFR